MWIIYGIVGDTLAGSRLQFPRWTAPTAWMASGIMAAELSSHPDSFAIRQLLGSNEQVSHASHAKLASACLDDSIVR